MFTVYYLRCFLHNPNSTKGNISQSARIAQHLNLEENNLKGCNETLFIVIILTFKTTLLLYNVMNPSSYHSEFNRLCGM